MRAELDNFGEGKCRGFLAPCVVEVRHVCDVFCLIVCGDVVLVVVGGGEPNLSETRLPSMRMCQVSGIVIRTYVLWPGFLSCRMMICAGCGNAWCLLFYVH